MNAEWLTNVVIIFVLFGYLAVEHSHAIHSKGRTKYGSKLQVIQHGPRRSGILETVQAMPTSPTPPTARVTTRWKPPANSTKSNVKNHNSLVNNKLDLKTNFSSPVHDKTLPSNLTVVQNTTNKLPNLASYSLDQPNSFPRPTSIPAIDTISAAWPTSMGSIDDEMEDISNPSSMQPIANEMSSEEKIPGIQSISHMERLPLDFQEEPAWERSNTSKVTPSHGHARFSLGHATRRHFVPSPSRSLKQLLSVKSRETTSAYAKQKGNFAENLKGLSRLQNTTVKINKISGKKKLKFRAQGVLKRKETRDGAKRDKQGSKKWKKRVTIPPPKPIDPIQPLLEEFKKEKEVGDIKEHTVDIESIAPHEAIGKHLISLESEPKIKPITEHLSIRRSQRL